MQFRSYATRIVLALLLVFVHAQPGWAHIRLDRSTPARGEVVTAPPRALRLEFSDRIEGRYTRLTLTGPDGTQVALGGIVFVDGSDRIITAQLPPFSAPGTYRVGWRTAGSDGHVLEGSYAFTLAADSTTLPTSTTTQEPATTPEPSTTPESSTAPAAELDHHHHEDASATGGIGDAFGRGLHFLALVLLAGAVTFRLALLPRLDVDAETQQLLRRRAWRVLSGAALLLAGAAVLRLWLQSSALHGPERAWSTPLLTMMLQDTAWGRAWVLQTFMFAVLGAAIVWARPGRDTAAAALALAATVALCTIPALTGHGASASGASWLVVANDTLHVFAAGAWLGTLFLLALSLPVITRGGDAVGRAVRAIDRFTPLALGAAALLVLSGLTNAVVHLGAPDQLWTTAYGRTLSVKIALVGAVLAVGFLNWRVVRPRMQREIGRVGTLRMSAATELLFALLVLAATAVLTGQARP